MKGKGVLAQVDIDSNSDSNSDESPNNAIDFSEIKSDEMIYYNDDKIQQFDNGLFDSSNYDNNSLEAEKDLLLDSNVNKKKDLKKIHFNTSGRDHEVGSRNHVLNQMPPRMTTLVRGKVENRTMESKLNPRLEIEALRREQNNILLSVLDEEKVAEAKRVQASREVQLGDVEERKKLEMIFVEERKRASERIINLTRLHEERLRSVIQEIDKE